MPPPNTPEPTGGDQPPAPGSVGRDGLAATSTAGRRRVVAFGVAVIAIAVVLFVLLSSTSGKLDPVAQAATRSASAPGYRARISMVMTSPAFGGAITASGTGVVASSAHAASVSMTMALPDVAQVTSQLGGNTLQLNEILRGTTVYIELPQALASKLPFSKRWIAIDVLKSAGISGLTSLPGSNISMSNPGQFLQYLRAAGGSVVTDGHARVDGYRTTHYQAQIDFSKVANAVPASQRAAVQQALATLEQEAHVGKIPVDVWIDRGHLVRRIGLTMKMTVSGSSLSMRMTEDLSDYGPQPTPAAPPADQVQTIG